MFGQLDELMAQQMSGRAGRRGLDTQGNLVYAGMRVSRIRRLMIGTVSNITGQVCMRSTPSSLHFIFILYVYEFLILILCVLNPLYMYYNMHLIPSLITILCINPLSLY
jgi:hypothetical protein